MLFICIVFSTFVLFYEIYKYLKHHGDDKKTIDISSSHARINHIQTTN